MTGNPKFIFNLCRNKRSKINIFQVIEDQYIFMEMNGVEWAISYFYNNLKTIEFIPFFLHKLNINLGFPVILSTK